MSYRIEPGRPVGSELERIARELAAPPDASLDPAKRVHEFRKNCKKLRAICRLVGDEPERRRIRDIARTFAGARDATVLLATFEEVAAPDEEPELRALLREQAAHPAGIPEIPALEIGWDLSGFGERELLAACRRAYRRARRAGKRAAAEPTPERVHEWRKRVKDHWYQMRLLGDPRRAELDELADLLGRANDLAVLAQRIGALGAGKNLLPRIRQRRREVVQRALARGAVLFAARPREFATGLRLG